MTDVSIIIAAWNAERFIGLALTAAMAQQGVSLEVIVADDASIDGTGAVVAQVDDPRVRYIRLPQNQGPAGARNAAFEAARGEWLMVLDADDRIAPNRAATLIDLARHEQADIVADNFQVLAQEGGAPVRLHIPETLDGSVENITLDGYVRANQLYQKAPSYGYLKPLFRRAEIEAPLHDSGKGGVKLEALRDVLGYLVQGALARPGGSSSSASPSYRSMSFRKSFPGTIRRNRRRCDAKCWRPWERPCAR